MRILSETATLMWKVPLFRIKLHSLATMKTNTDRRWTKLVEWWRDGVDGADTRWRGNNELHPSANLSLQLFLHPRATLEDNDCFSVVSSSLSLRSRDICDDNLTNGVVIETMYRFKKYYILWPAHALNTFLRIDSGSCEQHFVYVIYECFGIDCKNNASKCILLLLEFTSLLERPRLNI